MTLIFFQFFFSVDSSISFDVVYIFFLSSSFSNAHRMKCNTFSVLSIRNGEIVVRVDDSNASNVSLETSHSRFNGIICGAWKIFRSNVWLLSVLKTHRNFRNIRIAWMKFSTVGTVVLSWHLILILFFIVVVVVICCWHQSLWPLRYYTIVNVCS